MDTIKSPGPLKSSLQSKMFKTAFNFYLQTTENAEKAQKEQIGTLISYSGEQHIDWYNTFIFKDESKITLADVLAAFEKHF